TAVLQIALLHHANAVVAGGDVAELQRGLPRQLAIHEHLGTDGVAAHGQGTHRRIRLRLGSPGHAQPRPAARKERDQQPAGNPAEYPVPSRRGHTSTSLAIGGNNLTCRLSPLPPPQAGGMPPNRAAVWFPHTP